MHQHHQFCNQQKSCLSKVYNTFFRGCSLDKRYKSLLYQFLSWLTVLYHFIPSNCTGIQIICTPNNITSSISCTRTIISSTGGTDITIFTSITVIVLSRRVYISCVPIPIFTLFTSVLSKLKTTYHYLLMCSNTKVGFH